MSSPRSPRGNESPRGVESPQVEGSPRGGSPRGKSCWNWSDNESEGGDSEESLDAERPDKAKETVQERREPLRSKIKRCFRAFCRRITRCPKCRCCVYTMPCFYCCAPDQMLDREVLIEQLKAASSGKAPSMNLVEETMAADQERMAHHKKKWRSRWRVCSCCCCCSLLGGFIALVLLYATSPWQQLCDDCGWNKRAYFAAALHPDGRIFIVGGRNAEENFGDVWSGNIEGGDWQRLVEVAFGPRHGHALLCSRNGELVVLGGDEGGIGNQEPAPQNDLWRSTDGKTWAESGTMPWAPRKFLGAVIDEADRIYIAGGLGGHGSGGFNDLWISEDMGRSWRAVVLAAPWSGRYSFALVRAPGGINKGSLYLLAGFDGYAHHDVWLGNTEGSSWELMRFTHRREGSYDVFEYRAPWIPRFALAAVADSEGRIKIFGGQAEEEDLEGLFRRNAWELPPPETVPSNWWEKKGSDDRLNVRTTPPEWIQSTTPPWTARAGHVALVDPETNAVFILGGEGPSGYMADMWKEAFSINLVNLYNMLELGFLQVTSAF